MPDSAEEGFTVRDRRRVSTEEPAPASIPEVEPTLLETSPSALQMEQAETEVEEEYEDLLREEGMVGELPDVYSVLALFLNELRQLAWLRMGLVANPGTGQIEREMTQARVAIDTVAFLATQLEVVVSPEERLPLKALVSDLQINFVEQSKRG